jgi:hypothetical protein
LVGTYTRQEGGKKIVVGISEGRHHFGDIGVDRRRILKWILNIV